MPTSDTTLAYEEQLNSFAGTERRAALNALLGAGSPQPQTTETANMHCHTFFSFNAYGLSPTALVWLARQRGYGLMGIVDFDVLDAVDEFLDACDLLAVRGSAGIETRVFVPEFAGREINSPGEPGVLYHMGIGFTTGRVPQHVQPLLANLRRTAEERNRGLIDRVNAYLDPVQIEYEADVLPLTPAGNATERHVVVAYVAAVERARDEPARFWSEKLDLAFDETSALMRDRPKFQNKVRAALMKRGGVGYVQPSHDTFPQVETFHEMIVGCDALPCAAWLDGMSEGEQAMDDLLDLLVDKGVVALNIIPDRNWNIADPTLRQAKVDKLYEVVALARERDLPLNIGTEMNSFGQKFIDDFDAPALAPIADAFMDGAYFVYGHTVLKRRLGLGYLSPWAQAHLPERGTRNAFFTRIGRAARPGIDDARKMQALSPSMTPADILTILTRL